MDSLQKVAGEVYISTQVSGPTLGASADLLLLTWDLSQEMKECWNLQHFPQAASQQGRKVIPPSHGEKKDRETLKGSFTLWHSSLTYPSTHTSGTNVVSGWP